MLRRVLHIFKELIRQFFMFLDLQELVAFPKPNLKNLPKDTQDALRERGSG